jgi:hypothetical protein
MDYLFIVEDGDEYEHTSLLNCVLNKLIFDYIHTINNRIYKPDSKAEQNYAARLLKRIEHYYNKLYEYNFKNTFLYFLVSYHMEMRIHFYNNKYQ